MENIHIVDEFFGPEELHNVQCFVKSKDWKFGHTSGERETIVNRFHSTTISNDYFEVFIKKKIEQLYKIKVKVNRNYMHIQSFGQDGGYHIDDEGLDKLTFCVYITDIDVESMDTAGGEFLIKLPDEKGVICIDTLMNRGVIFPSYYLHKGMAYNRLFGQNRLCITWKLEMI